MNGIAALKKGGSFCKTYVAPDCMVMELNCEESFCLVTSNGGFIDVEHGGYVGSDYIGGWDN